MPQPVASDRVDQILTQISTAYIQQQDQFVHTKVAPVIPVMKQSDKYYTWTKADWFRDEMQRRADAAESAGSGMGLSNDNYFCDVWALHKDVGSQARANLQNEVDLDRATTLFLTQRALLRGEKQWASDYFTTSVWGTDLTPTNLWSDYVNSDPISDMETAKRTILSNTGMKPNTLVLGYNVFEKLKHHPDIVDRIKYTSAETVTAAMLGRIFEIERVFVAEAIENTANEGLTATMAFVHGKHALLAYVAMEPGLLTPSAMYTFAWTGDANNVSQGLGETIGVRRFYMEHLKADRFEVEIAFDYKVVGSDLGYFFNGAVA